jgi:hypothetical protein
MRLTKILVLSFFGGRCGEPAAGMGHPLGDFLGGRARGVFGALKTYGMLSYGEYGRAPVG